MRKKLPRIIFGNADDITNAFDQWVDAIEQALNVEGSGFISVDLTRDGIVIRDQTPVAIDVQLTSPGSTSGTYNFSQVFSNGSGGWTAYPKPITGVAWEYNLTSGILAVKSPYYCRVEWVNAGSVQLWRFQADLCS